MTKFQTYRGQAFDNLVAKEKRINSGEVLNSFDDLRKRAEFVARMRLAKENKKSNLQRSLFDNGQTIGDQMI